jgi:hypothetical protein
MIDKADIPSSQCKMSFRGPKSVRIHCFKLSCQLHLGTDHIENTSFPRVSLFLLAYSFARERVYRAVAQKRSLYIAYLAAIA